MDSNNIKSTKRIIAEEIKALLKAISDIVKTYGIDVVPYHNQDAYEAYELLPELKLTQIRDSLISYLNLCTDFQTVEKTSFSGAKALIWLAIKKLGYTPTSDLLDYVNGSSVIEIYNANFHQIFRNFNFFQYCSYTLEELHLNEWRELYERNVFIEKQVAIEAVKLFSGGMHTTTPITIGAHPLKERFSSKKLSLLGNFKYFSPLYNESKQIAACVVISEVQLTKDERTSFNQIISQHDQTI